MPTPALRLLLVEDSAIREERIRLWLPPEVHMVWAKSAGAAIGVLQRDRGRTYAGLRLDHDLQQQVRGGADGELTGQDVVLKVIEVIDKDVPILVHSMNDAGGAAMAGQLEKAGFEVTRWPWADMSKGVFERWLEEVREWTEE
ncbi:MAG: cyclic-phosphate processing receiver domain-containing protein [Myxococcota bacterium]|nr:cyclic-phosphate processing receiver domain-containing protein [Myxococcota bacterium]